MTFEEAKEQALKVKWESKKCPAGSKCWCRAVFPETDIMWTDENGDEHETYIIGHGSVDKETVEHIVKLHNNSL